MKTPKKNTSSFIDWVQHHERAWGIDSYPSRPSLEELLESPVVVFWQSNNKKEADRYTATMYQNLKDVEIYLLKMLFRAQISPPKRYIKRIFANQKEVRIKSVSVEFDVLESSE